MNIHHAERSGFTYPCVFGSISGCPFSQKLSVSFTRLQQAEGPQIYRFSQNRVEP